MSSLIDRALRPVVPVPVSGWTPPPEELAPGLWRLERRLRMPGGLTLPIGGTILRLPDGDLLVHSPPFLDDESDARVCALGRVAAVVASNSFHHLFATDALARFPGAALYLADGLRERVPTLPAGTVVRDEAPRAWQGDVEPIAFGPIGGFGELVLYHRSTRTLLLTDLAFNMLRFESTLGRIAWRLFGVPARFGPSRSARLTLLRDPKAARPFLEKMLEKTFVRVTVAHGDPVEVDAEKEFRRAFRRQLEAR